MDVKKLVRQAIMGIQKDHLKIACDTPGLSKVLRLVDRSAPGPAVAPSRPVDAMLAQTKLQQILQSAEPTFSWHLASIRCNR